MWISDGYSHLRRCDFSAACNKKKRKRKVALALLFWNEHRLSCFESHISWITKKQRCKTTLWHIHSWAEGKISLFISNFRCAYSLCQSLSSPGGLSSVQPGCRATSAQASHGYFINLGRCRLFILHFKVLKIWKCPVFISNENCDFFPTRKPSVDVNRPQFHA